MKLAKRIFLIAGILGLLTTIPLVFAEKVMGVKQPEFYYGFVCLNFPEISEIPDISEVVTFFSRR